jgi:hypothetical protein
MAPQEPKAVSKDEAPVVGIRSGKTEKKAEKKIDGNGGTIQRANSDTKQEKKLKGMSSETSFGNQSSSEIKPAAKTKVEVKTGTKSPRKAGNAQAETTGQGAASEKSFIFIPAGVDYDYFLVGGVCFAGHGVCSSCS